MKCTTFTVKIETTSSKKKGNPEEEKYLYIVLKTLYLATDTKQQLKSCHTSGIVWTFY